MGKCSLGVIFTIAVPQSLIFHTGYLCDEYAKTTHNGGAATKDKLLFQSTFPFKVMLSATAKNILAHRTPVLSFFSLISALPLTTAHLISNSMFMRQLNYFFFPFFILHERMSHICVSTSPTNDYGDLV